MDLFFLASLALVGLSVSNGEVIDLDNCASQFASERARVCGTTVRWFDLHGKQPHLREKYPGMKITVRTDNIRYGTTSRKLDRPGYVYTQWFHNGGSTTITGLVHKSKSVTSTFTWSVKESLKVGASVKIDAGVPTIVEGHIDVSTELNLASTQSKTTTTVDTFKVSHEIKIPPKSRVKATITITETELEVPWTATMFVTGYQAFWLEDKCRGHWLWFYKVKNLAACNPKLHGGDTPFGMGLSYEASGVFKAVQAVRATVKTKEYPL